MITAIPMKHDHISNHFTKADSFMFVDERGETLCQNANPALNTNCAGKSDLLEMLHNENVQRVVVRNIGEQFLGKLLDNKFSVYKTNCGHQTTKALVNDISSNLTRLTSAHQGRKSRNHEEKKANGGCGCDHNNHETKECRGEHNGRGQGKGKGRCCD